MTPAKPRQRGSEMSEEKLSVRLEMHAKVASSRAHWADVNGEADKGFWNAFAADIEAAAQLARRVEEAPVGEITAGYNGPCAAYGFTEADDVVMSAMVGQRVRLVREA